MRYTLLAAAFVAFGMSANAQVTVIGSGLARDCYLAAKVSTFDSRESIEGCTKALNHEVLSREDRLSTLINRGILYMRRGNQAQAMQDYDQALRINPNKAEAHLNRGAALIYLEEFAQARDALDRSIELGTKDLYAAYYNRGIANERTGDITAAYFDFRKSYELNPEFEIASQQMERFIVTEAPASNAGGSPA